MAQEVLDIVVRQRGARVVARDIAKIGVAADTTARSLKQLDATLKKGNSTLQTLAAREQQATRTTKTMTGAVTALGGAAKRTRVSLTALGTGAAIVGGALAAGIGRPLLAGIQIAADFQKAMNLVGVVTQVERGTAAFKEMERAAKQLGLTTQFTAVQAAEGMVELGRLGFTASEIVGALPSTLAAAAAGALSLKDASLITARIMNAFKLTTEDLPETIDAMSSAFTSSAADLPKLSLSFRDVAPIAAQAGQRFQDIVAVLGALADAGIEGQKAGIALRRIFINLVNDFQKGNSVLRAAGVEIRDATTGAFRPLIDILVDITKANLTAGQQIDLFGARALAAAGILDESSGSLARFSESITNQVGRAAEIAGSRLKGLSGGVILLSSATQILGQELAEAGLLNFLETVVSATTSFIRALARLPGPIKAVIGATLGLTAILGALALKVGIVVIALGVLGSQTGLGGVATGFKVATSAVRGFTVALLTNPIFLMITALIALSVILFKLRNELFEVGGRTVNLSAIWEVAGERISGAMKSASNAVREHFDKMLRGFAILTTGSDEWVKESLKDLDTFVTSLITVFISAGKIIAEFVTRTDKALSALFRDIGSFFIALPRAFSLAAQTRFTEAGQVLADAWTGGFTNAFKGFGTELTAGILRDFETVGSAVDKFFDDVEKRTRENAAKTRAAAEAAAKRAPGPTVPGTEGFTIGDPKKTTRGAKSIQSALDKLRETIADLTSTEQQLIKAQKTLTDAIAANLITANEAKQLYKDFAEQVLIKLQREVDPLNAALDDQTDKLRALKVAAGATGLDLSVLADSERRVKLATEDALLQLPEFTSGLKDTALLTLSVRKGFEGFADSIGSEFELISGFIQEAFQKGSDAIEDFLTTGELNFREFAASAIADLQRVIFNLLKLQAVRAFEQRGEAGGGISGFFEGLFGPRLEATRREAAPEVAARIKELGTATNPANSLIKNAENEPIPAKLIDPEAPGIVGLRDPIVNALTGPQGVKNTLVEQFTQLNATVQNLATALPSVGGMGGQQVTGAVGQLEATTSIVGEAQEAATKVGTGAIEETNKGGFSAIGGLLSRGFTSLVSVFVGRQGEEQKKGLFQIGGQILGAIVGAFAGSPQAGAQIGGQVGGIAGQLQKGATIQPGMVGQSFLVGEKGVELFTPPTTGTVVPNELLAGQTPELNVTVLNVDDATAVPEAMGTREGEQVVMNIIQRNRGRLREIIS